MLAGLQLQSVAKAVGDLQGKTLIRALEPEARALGLEPGDVGWAIGLPRRRHHIGRGVRPRLVNR